MKNRFKPNDTVMYGGHGACTLVEITDKDFGGEVKDYYVLRPAFSGSSIFYVPVDSEPLTSKMHSVKNADEILSLAKTCEPIEWKEEDRARQTELKAIVDGGGTEKLICAYKRLFVKQKELAEDAKKLRAADDRIMKDIEKLLLEEFSFSFEIDKEELAPFIFGELKLTQK
ncbi:MAG: hypothetical protein IJN48_03005 [Clostridia bacterium]|nr:hypothetical protein [Clostridia bacterium]